MDMDTTEATEGTAMNTTTTRTIWFGHAATYGGKIHRTEAGDHAWCLSNNGYKPLRSISVKVAHENHNDHAAHDAAEAAALIAAKISTSSLCTKCCGHVIDAMKEAGA
jgi:hypothetical protein